MPVVHHTKSCIARQRRLGGHVVETCPCPDTLRTIFDQLARELHEEGWSTYGAMYGAEPSFRHKSGSIMKGDAFTLSTLAGLLHVSMEGIETPPSPPATSDAWPRAAPSDNPLNSLGAYVVDRVHELEAQLEAAKDKAAVQEEEVSKLRTGWSQAEARLRDELHNVEIHAQGVEAASRSGTRAFAEYRTRVEPLLKLLASQTGQTDAILDVAEALGMPREEGEAIEALRDRIGHDHIFKIVDGAQRCTCGAFQR